MAENVSLARRRLNHERNEWKKDHPPGFVAKFDVDDGGKPTPLKWKCIIPGKKGSLWEGGEYPLSMEFTEDYPSKPPKCRFAEKLFHPNIYPSGTVCLSILNEDEDWKPSITIKQILLGIQDLLDNPNVQSPAQHEPLTAFTGDRKKYDAMVRQCANKYRPRN